MMLKCFLHESITVMSTQRARSSEPQRKKNIFMILQPTYSDKTTKDKFTQRILRPRTGNVQNVMLHKCPYSNTERDINSGHTSNMSTSSKWECLPLAFVTVSGRITHQFLCLSYLKYCCSLSSLRAEAAPLSLCNICSPL